MGGGCRRGFSSRGNVVRRKGSLIDLTPDGTGPAEVRCWRHWAVEPSGNGNREPPEKHEIEDIFDPEQVLQAANERRDLKLELIRRKRGRRGSWRARRRQAVALPASKWDGWSGASIIGTERKYLGRTGKWLVYFTILILVKSTKIYLYNKIKLET